MSMKFIFGISALAAIGVFLFTFGYLALGNVTPIYFVVAILSMAVGAATLVSAFLLYRHSDKQ